MCARERGEHGAVGIRQLAGSEFCWGRDEFFARRNDRYARAAVDRDGINASGGESGDYGAVRNCLFGNSETPLRELLRSGASDEEIMEAWAEEMWSKKPGHGIDDEGFLQPDRPMSSIGG